MVYGTFIKVLAGFYIGCVGTVTDLSLAGYRAELACRVGKKRVDTGIIVTFPIENDIKEITEEEYDKYIEEVKCLRSKCKNIMKKN